MKMAPKPVLLRAPAGVPENIHDDIMRRIRNRWYDNTDKCSLRRGGPGLVELAGVLPLVCTLPAEAVRAYADELIALKPLYASCLVCRGKWCGFVYLVLAMVDRKEALPWLNKVSRVESRLAVRGPRRDFIAEILKTRC